MDGRKFLGMLEIVCLLIWVPVTQVCSVCENYQPVNMRFICFSVCTLYFNNNLFFFFFEKASEGKEYPVKEPKWNELEMMGKNLERGVPWK